MAAPALRVAAAPSAAATVLPRGASARQVRDVLAGGALREVRVLKLLDAEGAFSGWDVEKHEWQAFNLLEKYYLLGGDFCCTSREANEGRLYPQDPPRLRGPGGTSISAFL